MPKPPTTGPDGHGAGADGYPASSEYHGQISRSLILQTALGIIDRDGVDGLSMRRLSDAVGRDPMVLYRHLPNKAAVLDGVAEIVLEQLSVDTADPDWAAQLRIVAHDFRRLAITHPNVVPLLVTRPLATPLGQRPPGMLRPLEDVLTLLTSAGFTGTDALHIYRLLFGFLHGHILNELQEVVERPEETDDVLRLGLHRLPITEFPHVRALAPALASYDGEGELKRGLDLLLTGLVDGNLHVAQLSMHPCRQRQGIGGRLLEAAADYASASGLDTMTLTTFRDIQWNAPWYAKRGFAILPESLWGDGLRSIWVNEAAAGIMIAPRVVMCRIVAGDARHSRTGPPRDGKDRLRRRQ